eukprot:GDKJ01023758.1.p1 GENE.GDKJ01023758.1~~GDKJ01023758.1.p1  ORF type:complete len:139 (+),score=18.51 GDKJ01023758.1:18-434(+)
MTDQPHYITEFDYRRWDAQDWVEFSRRIGFPDYAATISQNFVSTLELHRCRQQHLVQLGIQDFEHQKFLMAQIQLLFRGEHPIQIEVMSGVRSHANKLPKNADFDELDAMDRALRLEGTHPTKDGSEVSTPRGHDGTF